MIQTLSAISFLPLSIDRLGMTPWATIHPVHEILINFSLFYSFKICFLFQINCKYVKEMLAEMLPVGCPAPTPGKIVQNRCCLQKTWRRLQCVHIQCVHMTQWTRQPRRPSLPSQQVILGELRTHDPLEEEKMG